MSKAPIASRDELDRIRRVSDLLCTAHATLRDRYSRRAFLLDIIILLSSAWLTALSFLDPRFNRWLVPFDFDPSLWIGLLGVITFGLTLVQFKTDWKGRSEAHKRSFGMYVEVKREASYLLSSPVDIPFRDFQRLAARYDMASDVGTGVPEKDFLRLKRAHKLKIEASRALDEKPGMSIAWYYVRAFYRDNFK